MFDASLKDDVRIAAPYLAPSPPASAVRPSGPPGAASYCLLILICQFSLLFPLNFSLWGGREVLDGSKVIGFVSERLRLGERQGGAGSLWCESLVLQQPAAPLELCRGRFSPPLASSTINVA